MEIKMKMKMPIVVEDVLFKKNLY